MTTRSRQETFHFKRSFLIKGVDRLLPSGGYEVITMNMVAGAAPLRNDASASHE